MLGGGDCVWEKSEKTEISPLRRTPGGAAPASAGGPGEAASLPSRTPSRAQLTAPGELRGPPRVVRARAALLLAAPPPGTRQTQKRAGKATARSGGGGGDAFLPVESFGFFRSVPSPPQSQPGFFWQLLARSRGRDLAQSSPPPPRASSRPSLSASLSALRSRHGADGGLLRVGDSQQRALRPKSPRAGYGLRRTRGHGTGKEVGYLRNYRPHDEFPQGGRSEQPVPEGAAHRHRAVLRGPGGVGEVLGHLPPGQGQPGRRQHR